LLEPGLRVNRRLKVNQRFRQAVHLSQGQAEIVLPLAEVRIETHRLGELGHRLLHASRMRQGDPEVVASSGRARIELDGLLEMLEGVVHPALCLEKRTETGMGACGSWCDLQSSTEVPLRLRDP